MVRVGRLLISGWPESLLALPFPMRVRSSRSRRGTGCENATTYSTGEMPKKRRGPLPRSNGPLAGSILSSTASLAPIISTHAAFATTTQCSLAGPGSRPAHPREENSWLTPLFRLTPSFNEASRDGRINRHAPARKTHGLRHFSTCQRFNPRCVCSE
jgi:hypothetical protein